MKRLVINGVLYAFYQVDGDVVFLNVVVEIIPRNTAKSEELLAIIIESVEGVRFSAMGYLHLTPSDSLDGPMKSYTGPIFCSCPNGSEFQAEGINAPNGIKCPACGRRLRWQSAN